MELHRNTANAFADYLTKHGYPKESIAFEWGDQQHSVDIAILELDSNAPISIYEIKGQKDPNSLKMAIVQLKKTATRLNAPINYGVVFAKNDAPFFEYIDVTKFLQSSSELSYAELMSSLKSIESEPIAYKNRAQSIKSDLISKHEKRKKQYGGMLEFISFYVAPITIIILIFLDAASIYDITTERLVLLGIYFAMPIIPFIREIKVEGYSISLKDGKKGDYTKDK